MISIPDGFFDVVFNECENEHTEKLINIFKQQKFREVSTPILEYYDLFLKTGSPIPETSMFKLISDRKICVLRPDSTTPIARLCASRLANEPLPLKLFYNQPVFRADTMRAKIPQVGIEAIGEFNDSEILKLAEDCLKLFNRPYHIEISHAGIFNELTENFSPNDKAEIHSLILRKNYAALGDVLSSYGTDAAKDLLSLVVSSETTPHTKGIIPFINEIRKHKKYTIDFGLVQSPEYYTGIVFRGYIEGVAGEVLAGGRYDKLMGMLGRAAPAIGFVVNTEVY